MQVEFYDRWNRLLSTKDSPLNIFKPNIETINLFLSLLGPLICIPSFFSSGSAYESITMIIIIFSAIHVGLSFSLLFTIPEIRKSVFVTHRKHSFNKFIWVLCYITIPLLSFEYFLGSNRTQNEYLFFVRNFIVSFAAVGHYFQQFFGVNSIYNEKIKGLNTTSLSTNARGWYIQERKILGLSGFLGILVFPTHFSEITINGFSINQLSGAFSFSSVLLIAFLILKNLKRSTNTWSNKELYMVRSMAIPFFMINPVTAIVNKILHSTEYIFIYDKILSHSKVNFKSGIFWKVTSVILLILIVMVTRVGKEVVNNTDFKLQFFVYYHFGINIAMHYWGDSVLFAMKNKETRSFMGSILTS